MPRTQFTNTPLDARPFLTPTDGEEEAARGISRGAAEGAESSSSAAGGEPTKSAEAAEARVSEAEEGSANEGEREDRARVAELQALPPREEADAR